MKIILTLMLMLLMSSTVGARDVFWYDINSGIEQWKKVVIFPLVDADNPDHFLINRDEKSELYWKNKYLMEHFEKKIKNMHTIRLSPDIKEKGEILLDKYSDLLKPFASERERAEAVFERTGADLYIIPSYRRKTFKLDAYKRLQYDFAEQKWKAEFDRRMDSVGAANGFTGFIHVMELNIKGYDVEGNEVFSFTDERHNAAYDERSQFREIAAHVRQDIEDIKSGKHDFANQSGRIKIGFKDFLLPTNLGLDEHTLRGIYFALKVNALEKLEPLGEIELVFDMDDPTPLDYYVTGEVHQWNLKSTWVTSPPTEQYKMNGWIFDAYVSMNMQLVDARTGTAVIEDVYSGKTGRIMDAYYIALDEFYTQVSDYFNAKRVGQ
ncbi:MAG: hypothetical protein IJ668_01700 [Selenomonadaceae bacterium]|nr:hypothetical protein [Selenomonadaceae bacterium]